MATRRRSGNGKITGSISDIQRRVKYLEGRPSYSKLATSVVQRVNIEPRAISTDQIALSAVTNDQLAADAITQASLATDSITRSELQDDSVGSSEISTDSIGTDELGIDSALNENFGTDSINNSNLGNDSVGSSEILQDSIGTGQLAVDSLGSSEISVNAIGAGEIAGNSVGSDEVSTDAVGNDELGVNSGYAENIFVDAVGNSELGNYAVDSSNMSTDSVDGRVLQNGSITSDNIQSSAVGYNELADGAISDSKIQNGTIQATDVESDVPTRMLYAGLLGSSSVGIEYTPSTIYFRMNVGNGADVCADGSHGHIGSSRKIKRDISDIEVTDFKQIFGLNLKKFQFIERYKDLQYNRDWSYGVIAEEVLEQGMEEFLEYNDKGLPSGINYPLVSSYCVEILKGHREDLEQLKRDIEDLKDNNGN